MADHADAGEILLLHPGEMGAALGRLLTGRGQAVTWVPAGRGATTAARAEAAGLAPRVDLAAALQTADLVLSVCPPHAAEASAAQVAAAGWRGPYLDANAVAPGTVRRLAETLAPAPVVDGGIVGPPPGEGRDARLFLSGPGAPDIARLFAGSPLEPVTLEGPVGAASAVKMAYGGWTKGSAALLLALRGFARAEGVEDALLAEWRRSQPAVAARGLERDVAKAWRFAGEMREVAEALERDGLPPGFHAAAADLFERLVGFRDDDALALDDALAQLIEGRPPG